MNNEEALAALVTKRTAINDAINGLLRYERESDDWKNTVATRQMAAVKASATDVGADIDAWDGTPAPEEP
tara:strand:- start:323 stop:532 length:210 start_codon:yes stop_codon:yes gene_type:complete